MGTVQETYIPAGAWLNADGTVDITVGGQVLDGGHGVNMQTAIHALRRYAAQHGSLLMTTMRPDGRTSMDTVHPDGTVKKYEAVSMAPAGPLGHGSLSPAVELDFFGLPPLGPGHTPPVGMSRHGRAEAFSDRPVFRPANHAPSGFENSLASRPPDRGLGAMHHRTPAAPYRSVPVVTDDASHSHGMSVKAVATKRNRVVSSPLRTIAFVLVTLLLAGAVALYGPMILLHPGSSDPLQFWQHPAPPPSAPPQKPAR
jgi:hypothetical protein